jgi:hypothetical protein
MSWVALTRSGLGVISRRGQAMAASGWVPTTRPRGLIQGGKFACPSKFRASLATTAPASNEGDDQRDTSVNKKQSQSQPQQPIPPPVLMPPTAEDAKVVDDVVSRLTSNEEVVDLQLSRLPNESKLNMVNAIMDSSQPPMSGYTPSAVSGRHRHAIAVSAFAELTRKHHGEEVKKVDVNSGE